MNKFNFQAWFSHYPENLIATTDRKSAPARGRDRGTPENPDESQLFGNAIQRPLQQELPVQKR